MKKICFLFLLSVGLVLSSCKNYDDRFDALNGQITALQGQVTGLSALQTEVTALKSTITAIQSSLSGLQGTVTTVQSEVTTALQTTQSEVTTALETAQTEITKNVGDQLNTGLSGLSEKNEALSKSLAELLPKVTALETKLQSIQDGAVSKDELTKLQTDLAEQYAVIKGQLDESLRNSNFHNDDLIIDSVGRLKFATSVLFENITEINGDVTIDTTEFWEVAGSTEEETNKRRQDLKDFAKRINLIYGTLDITHGSKELEDAIKFENLTLVTKLVDKQPHVHYPALASVNEITFAEGDDTNTKADNVLTVQIPEITTARFTGGKIHLKKGQELHLTGFVSHKGNLTINLGGNATFEGGTTLDGAKTDLEFFEGLNLEGNSKAEATLELIGFHEVKLPALTKLKKLRVEDVNTVIAENVQGAILEIGEDVENVTVGTKAAITELHIRPSVAENRDLRTLKIGGTLIGDDATVVEIPTRVREAHIFGRGVKSLTTTTTDEDSTNDLTVFSTKDGTEIKDLTLDGTDIRDLELEHTSGTGGSLVLTNNQSLESLKANKVNNLKTLKIQSNEDLASIEFTGLEIADKDAKVHIGGVGNKNNLIATSITLKVEDKKDAIGKIVDESGLSSLNEFLSKLVSKNDKTEAVVYYDGAEGFREVGEVVDSDNPISIRQEANAPHLLLFRKGVAPTKAAEPEKKAKRVFVATIPTTPGDITIGAAGAYETITLDGGGTPANWKSQINADEVTTKFGENNVTVKAEVGGNPTGNITFGGVPTDAAVTLTEFTALGLPDEAYVKLSIGSGTNQYSHTVYLTEPESGDLDDEEGFGEGNKKEAISHLILGDGDDADTNIDAGGLAILNKLLQAFPGPTGPDGTYYSSTPADTDRDFAINPDPEEEGVPYYVENINTTTFVIDIEPYDKKRIGKAILVDFDTNVNEADLVTLGFIPVTAADPNASPAVKLNFVEENSIKDAARTLTITLTSGTPGAEEEDSTIGQPQDTSNVVNGTDEYTTYAGVIPDLSNDSKAYVNLGANKTANTEVIELVTKGTATQNTDYPYWSTAPQKGVDGEAAVDTNTKDKNRLTWL